MRRTLSRKNLWDRLPRAVKTVTGSVFRCIPPAVLLGRRFRRNLAFVREAQWWPIERAREYQLERLRQICTLAHEKTLFYRHRFQAVGFEPGDLKSLEDLTGLPSTDKTTVIENLDAMRAVPPTAAHVDHVSTGGTSGTPLHFNIGADRSATEYAYLVTSWQRAGYQLGQPMAVLRGRIVPEDRHGLRHECDSVLRHHYYSNFHMTDANMQKYLEHIRGIGACFLHVYPSSAAALARLLLCNDVMRPDNIRGIIAESEIVFPEQRRFVEDVFGCRYFSCYGHTEKLVAAAECEASNDYHVWPTYGFFELLDEKGDSVTEPGKRGEIVGTGFINTVMPFIRYRTGDFATYVGDRCGKCGREHVLIRDVRGHRTQEFLVARDGHAISWTSLNMHDGTFCNVRRFQFFQDTQGHAVLRFVPGDRFDESDRKRMLRNLERKLDSQLDVSLESVPEISASPRGKAIYVDQRLSARHLME